MKKLLQYAFVIFISIQLSGCNDDANENSVVDENLNSAILKDLSTNIPQTVYTELGTKTSALYDKVIVLETSTSDASLAAAQQAWRDARKTWEQSEAHLFGPVSTDNIDPRIDTWPVNFTDLDAQLASGNAFTDAYVDNLEDALKGFHPVEYLLFGESGTKKAADFTARQKEYLKALTKNLKLLTSELAENWSPANMNGYYTILSNPGPTNAVYQTQRAALEEIVNAMIGICDEVANGKITEPLLQQDAALEESPFAKSSLPDFTNNIKGVENVYLGKYTSDGKGIEDLVKKYNLSLDNAIKQKHAAAVASLGNVTKPFGEAIFSQQVQVQNAINAINELKTVLEDELLLLVQQHSN